MPQTRSAGPLIAAENLFASIYPAHGHGGNFPDPQFSGLYVSPPLCWLPVCALCLMKPWTTPPQFAWLTERIPQWHLRHEKAKKRFLPMTVAAFIETFPDCKFSSTELHTVSAVLVHTHHLKPVTNLSTENSTMVLFPRPKGFSSSTHRTFHPCCQTSTKSCSPHARSSILALVLSKGFPSS